MSKKRPPFSRPLSELLNSGQRPTNSIYLYIGSKSWDKGTIAARFRPERTMVLPPKENPFLYDWPVFDCDILVIDTGDSTEEYIDLLGFCLTESGAEVVRVIAPNNLIFSIYKRNCNDE